MTENKTTGGDPETDIFSERTQLKPYEYPDVLEYKDAIRNSYWVHTEFNFSGDVQDFKVNTTPAEKTVIKRTMLAIAQIEVQVKTFWADIYDEMPKAEIGNVGMTFAESEVRHMDAYSHLLDILGITEDFEEVTDVPAIKERIDYLDEYLEKSESDDTQEYVMSLPAVLHVRRTRLAVLAVPHHDELRQTRKEIQGNHERRRSDQQGGADSRTVRCRTRGSDSRGRIRTSSTRTSKKRSKRPVSRRSRQR